MIADLKPSADHKESGLPCLGLVAILEWINADILAIEKEAEGLLGDLLGGRVP